MKPSEMQTVPEILTELVDYAIDRVYEQLEDPEPSAKVSGYTVRAITNAAKQIEDQQRERVEKTRDALVRFGHHVKLCPCLDKTNTFKNKEKICNCEYGAALAELEE